MADTDLGKYAKWVVGTEAVFSVPLFSSIVNVASAYWKTVYVKVELS
jgi:hypothetical protein